MKNRVIVETSFRRPAKNLAKRYPSFPQDLLQLIVELESNALLGVSLGGHLRKIRMSIKSKGKGKSGGARVIAYALVAMGRVHLLTVYDKSDKDTVSDAELKSLI